MNTNTNNPEQGKFQRCGEGESNCTCKSIDECGYVSFYCYTDSLDRCAEQCEGCKGDVQTEVKKALEEFARYLHTPTLPAYTSDQYINAYINSRYPVNHPSHYADGKIEVIDFIEDKKLGFHLGNAVKYISRAGKKNPEKIVEDLEKAKWYLQRCIDQLKESLEQLSSPPYIFGPERTKQNQG